MRTNHHLAVYTAVNKALEHWPSLTNKQGLGWSIYSANQNLPGVRLTTNTINALITYDPQTPKPHNIEEAIDLEVYLTAVDIRDLLQTLLTALDKDIATNRPTKA